MGGGHPGRNLDSLVKRTGSQRRPMSCCMSTAFMFSQCPAFFGGYSKELRLTLLPRGPHSQRTHIYERMLCL